MTKLAGASTIIYGGTIGFGMGGSAFVGVEGGATALLAGSASTLAVPVLLILGGITTIGAGLWFGLHFIQQGIKKLEEPE